MNKKIAQTVISMICVALMGCAAMTPTYETQEAYAVYDGAAKPTPQLTEKLLNDITNAVKINVSDVRSSRGIPPDSLPPQPGKFDLQDFFPNGNMAALMQASGANAKLPVCQQPIMSIRSNDTSMSAYGEKSTFFVCVMPFSSGYRTAVYASFTRASGGMNFNVLGATLGRNLVGDSSQFIPRVMADIKSSMETNLGNVKVVKSYIPESFKGPLVDKTNAARSSN